MRCRYCALVVSLVLFAGCSQEQKNPPLFRQLTPDQTGVRFANTITTSDSENVQTDVYVYNGAGVAIGDIDNDGLPDIFFSGNMVSSRLYLNKGNMRFDDVTQAAGVGTKRWATGATMVDINNDGYLDIYVSVSEQAGILRQVGYGLGVAVTDFNGDGRPDIYVSNDVAPNDVLYINNGDGTFTDKAARWLKHTSLAGMGVDVADFNNDGWPDIAQVDMMPPNLARRKRMSGYLTYGSRVELHARGFRDDFDANSLQLSNGLTHNGDVIFSEIGRLAGIAYTDWSWTALFADFDNDGYKDILITNGYPKAVNDLDYQAAVFRARRVGDAGRALRLLKELPGYDFSNYLFRNKGDLTFTDMTQQWGMDRRGFSYGAAYADLNNDGKLDLVVNHIDAPASIYENVQPDDDVHHYLQIRLDGEPPNRRGIGAQLILTAGGQKQYLYHSPYRAYMSTMDDREHFGPGRAKPWASLEVIWPDGRRQVLMGLAVDRMLTVRQGDGMRDARCEMRHGCGDSASRIPHPASRVFEPVDPRRALKYKHQTPTFSD